MRGIFNLNHPLKIIIGGVMLAGLISALFLFDRFRNNRVTLPQLESYLGIVVPDSAQEIKYSYNSFMDVTARVRFSLPVKDLDAFLDQLHNVCLWDDLIDNYNPFPLDLEDWWKPTQAKFFAGQRCRNDTDSYQLFIDKTNPVNYTIYLLKA